MKRYVIEAVWNDPDYGLIGEERSFTFKRTALVEWDKMEKRRGNLQMRWHYRLRDTRTGAILAPVV